MPARWRDEPWGVFGERVKARPGGVDVSEHVAIAGATAFVFIAFGIHVASGGAYAHRTVLAMSLRLLVWAAIARFAWWRLLRPMKLTT